MKWVIPDITRIAFVGTCKTNDGHLGVVMSDWVVDGWGEDMEYVFQGLVIDTETGDVIDSDWGVCDGEKTTEEEAKKIIEKEMDGLMNMRGREVPR